MKSACKELRTKRLELLSSNAVSGGYQAPTEKSDGAARFVISCGQLGRLRSINFSWSYIARILGVSRSTIHRRRKELNIEDNYTVITDLELDDVLVKYKDQHPYTGEREIEGYLRGAGIKIQRFRIRDSIHRVDPINTSLRWHQPIKRRPYSVRGPNSLWHIDTNMKLIRWGFTIQGGVDGFTRVVVYGKCSLNNRADTTLQLFKEAEIKHRKPSRVRSDYDNENRSVALYMVESRGMNRGSILTGPSTHNTRIERLWKECGKSFIHLFSRIFSFLETREQCLDMANSYQLYSLHYVFLPRIDRALQVWVNSWNNHPISGCKNLSALQLREQSFLSLYGDLSDTVRDVFEPPLADCLLEEYGIDGMVSNHMYTNDCLETPTVSLPVDEHVGKIYYR